MILKKLRRNYYKKVLLDKFDYCVKDKNENEVVLCGGYVRNTCVTIKKEWISWIANTLRSMLPYEYYDPSSIKMKKNEDCILAIEKIVTHKNFSWLEIYTQKYSEYKRIPPFTIPYLLDNPQKMKSYIEPVICELEKYAL